MLTVVLVLPWQIIFGHEQGDLLGANRKGRGEGPCSRRLHHHEFGFTAFTVFSNQTGPVVLMTCGRRGAMITARQRSGRVSSSTSWRNGKELNFYFFTVVFWQGAGGFSVFRTDDFWMIFDEYQAEFWMIFFVFGHWQAGFF